MIVQGLITLITITDMDKYIEQDIVIVEWQVRSVARNITEV